MASHQQDSDPEDRADGSRREGAWTGAVDDEDASFDGYDADAPEAGRKSNGPSVSGANRPSSGPSGSLHQH